ncbi:MAG TPA: sigma-70 family RNA polymerase sigma factor [Rubrobacteraceae bacterium]|nr:sigma-70 family RNA polymerase sigma factor [Rubrobacteraceae bacterium]
MSDQRRGGARHLASAKSDLGEQEQVVATFYFYEDLTVKEIGKALNLTEGRISQILRDALTKLRKRPKDSPTTLGNWQETFS